MTEKFDHNKDCTSSSHDQHLCYLVAQAIMEKAPIVNRAGWPTPVELEDLVNAPQYKCEKCRRVANSEKNLCEPADFSQNPGR